MAINPKKILSTRIPTRKLEPLPTNRYPAVVVGVSPREVVGRTTGRTSTLLDFKCTVDAAAIKELQANYPDQAFTDSVTVSKFVNLDGDEISFAQGQNDEIFDILKTLKADATQIEDVIGANCELDVVLEVSAKGNGYNNVEFVIA